MKTLVMVALLSALSFAGLFAANVEKPNEEQHNMCCEKKLITTEAGEYYEERWLCFLQTSSCQVQCKFICDCGEALVCGSHTFRVVLCLSHPSASAPQCSQEDYDVGYASFQSFRSADGCLSVAIGQGCACVNPCENIRCSPSELEISCNAKCP